MVVFVTYEVADMTFKYQVVDVERQLRVFVWQVDIGQRV